MVWLGASTEMVEVDFTIVSPGLWVTPTVADEGSDVVVPPIDGGLVPVDVAESWMEPLLRSAWVTV